MSQKSLGNKKNTRAQIELLRSRIDLLKGKDRFLMTLYLENDYSIFQISQLINQCETSIARRIKRLTKSLLEGRYITCLRYRNKFNKNQMAVAKDYFLIGLSMREIAIKRRRSMYRIRETILKIKSILNECKSDETK